MGSKNLFIIRINKSYFHCRWDRGSEDHSSRESNNQVSSKKNYKKKDKIFARRVIKLVEAHE